jgi:hypothetical protein
VKVNELSILSRVFTRSVGLILSGQSPAGSYPACPAYPVYRYSWLRDGSFIAESMSRAGHPASATAFFDWCATAITDRRTRIESLLERSARGQEIPLGDFLPTRYRLDGADAVDATEQWWNFQLDGYGMWMWAVGQHVKRYGCDPHRWAGAIRLTVRYLGCFWHLPCYDWWEEHSDHRHTSTLAAIHAGLSAALSSSVLDVALAGEAVAVCAQIRRRIYAEGIRHGRLVKWLGGEDIDASLTACFTPFGLVPAEDRIAHATIEAIEQSIAHGGVHRYPGDTFYGGGEWPLLAALLGWHYARTGRTAEAWQQLRWVAAQANMAGDLPEQVSGHLLHPEHHREWTDRWGPVASPLLWSHAMFLILATELGLGLENNPDPPIGHWLHGSGDATEAPSASPGLTRFGDDPQQLQTAPRGDTPLELGIGLLSLLTARPQTWPSSATRIRDFAAMEAARTLRPPELLDIYGKHALHCTITSVDIAAFGDYCRDDEVRIFVRSALYETLSGAFDDAGVGWRRSYHEDRGDGILAVVGPHVPASLILDPLVLSLRARLRHHNKLSSDVAKIRLRMAVHAGPVLFDPGGVVGHAVIHLSRLLDAPALKRALSESAADLALVASDNLYDTVIRHGGGLIDPKTYRRVDIVHKETRTQAWLLTL